MKAGGVVNETRSEILIGRFFGQAFEANRLIIGPAVEFRITPKVAFEFDVLFQSADLRGAGASAAIFPRSSWQADTSIRYFPVLAKYRLRKQNFTPLPLQAAHSDITAIRVVSAPQRSGLPACPAPQPVL